MSLPTRKPNRLPIPELYQKGYWYFVTICAQNKKCIFTSASVGAIPQSPANTPQTTTKPSFSQQNNQLQLTKIGKIIEKQWLDLPSQFTNLEIDEFVIMPNHFHGIIGFDGEPKSKFTNKLTDLSKIIKRFKQETMREIKSILQQVPSGDCGIAPTKIWQKSFWDHIIRDEKDLQRIREYIYNNPVSWELDELNPNNKTVYS